MNKGIIAIQAATPQFNKVVWQKSARRNIPNAFRHDHKSRATHIQILNKQRQALRQANNATLGQKLCTAV